VYLTVYY